MKNEEPGFILLAAGKSTRFGSNKLLTTIDGKQTLLLQTAKRILSISNQLLVVSNDNDTAISTLLDEQAIARISTPDSELGMAHSLAYGVQQRAHWNGWIICLADMPTIRPTTYQAVQHALKDQKLVVPRYKNRAGNPVGFSKPFFNRLIKLEGDKGAKSILQANSSQVFHLNCEDPGILLDADTPEKLEILKSQG